jgi:hypothetical protein
MAIRIISNKPNGTVVVQFDATGTLIIAGNNSVSNIALPGEIVNGATIRRVIHGANSGGGWSIKRAANAFGTYINSGEINYSGMGMVSGLDASANVVCTLNAGEGQIQIELAKNCNNYPSIMAGKKLLVEFDASHEMVETITEGANGKKSLYIEGIFLQSEIKNRNGRIYPKSVMESAVQKYITEKIDRPRNIAYGELQHPSGPNINADRVSHIVESLKWDGNNVIGKAKIGGPKGDDVVKLMELGGGVGVSSRGLGTLKASKSGIMEVQNDYRIAAAADIVLDPSAPDAFVTGIMENHEYFYDIAKGVWMPLIEQTHKKMHKMSVKQIEESKQRVFAHFLRQITSAK